MVHVYELDVVSPDSLGRFVYRWYGPPDRPPLPVDHPGVPAPLVEWHRLAARYTYPLTRDHLMLPLTAVATPSPDDGPPAGNGTIRSAAPAAPPAEWQNGALRSGHSDAEQRNGTVRFWEGAEDFFAYDGEAFRAGAADPEVVENGEVPTGLTLSRFLVYAAVYEATYAPLHGLVCMNPAPDDLRAAKVRLHQLDDSIWQWPDPQLRYYGDDDLLAHLGPDRIVIAGRHRDALGRFDGLALPWDWDTRRL